MSDEELVMFGDRIKSFRFQLRKSQKEFAKILGISPSFLSDVEAGKTKPGYEFFKNITMKCNAHPIYLFLGKGDMFFREINTEHDRLLAIAEDMLGSEQHILEKLLWDLGHIELVRFAVLDFYSRYRYRNKDQIDQMEEKILERLSREKKEKESPTS